MADDTYYRRTLHQIFETVSPDDLVQGWVTQDMITIAASGDLKRGTLLMTGTGGFIPATSEGLASAKELCILSSSKDIPEGNHSVSYAYFSGTFSAECLILPYEAEGDDHAALVEAARETLRQHKIFVK